MQIKIYGKAHCPGCVQAKNYLTAKQIEFDYIDVMTDPAMLNLFRSRGYRTVPQIFDGEMHIGGFAELQNYIK